MSTKSTNTDDQNANDVETTGLSRHHVPGCVIHRILRLLPTIPAARMSFLSNQWEGLRSSGCVLDFVEDNLDGELDDRPGNFINTCDWYIDQFRECDKISVDKFMLILNRIKQKLCAGDGIPIKRMSLFFCGIELENEFRNLSKYDICEFFEIVLFLKTMNGIKSDHLSRRLSLVQSRP